MQTVQVPNIVLNNLWIENVTRSKAMKEVIDVNVFPLISCIWLLLNQHTFGVAVYDCEVYIVFVV
ncbi:hypothetical protein PG984_001462 [Apiospora sp. TS-2023a]